MIEYLVHRIIFTTATQTHWRKGYNKSVLSFEKKTKNKNIDESAKHAHWISEHDVKIKKIILPNKIHVLVFKGTE